MNRHITNKKPSLTQQILTTLGFGVSPQKVNCWYCCQDSYLLPGSKNTVKHWYCNLCESTNIRDEKGEIADPTVFEASSTRHIPSIERTPSSIRKNSSKTLCSDCVANQEIIYRYLADYIPDESDPTYQIKFNSVDEYKAKLHQRYKLCNECQQKISKLNEEQREYMKRMRFTASLIESAKPQTLARPPRHAHRLRGCAWLLVHAWTILFGVFCIVYHPQNTHFNVSSKVLQLHQPDILQEWMDYLSDTSTTLFDPVRCVFSRTDESCYWDMSYQHVIILVLMTSLSFVLRNWHHLLIEEAADKLKNYSVYKNVQKVLILLRWALFALIAMDANRTMEVAVLVVYCSLLVASYSAVRRAIWPYSLIGKSRREEVQVEKEEDSTAEPMDIEPDHPQQQQQQQQHYQHSYRHQPYQQQYQPDVVDSLVNGLHQIAF
ncbi:Saccharopine dehydrogenase [Mucor velutinosus]|uniref:Saccharopine dehydrogenase n=1 Tax=Mucor velutinosus TaxID=708070 RepID=A0AAN7D4Y7_9FUNG|nr:Saccharopine dehydrogenase [Mucor velutinosus]